MQSLHRVEKSPPHGTGGITVGDLSTQSIMGAVPICPIPTRSPARDDDVGERPSRHFDRSEAEWRNLTPLMTEKPLASSVISTKAKRSGEISLLNSPGSMEAENLRVRVPLEPRIPARYPLEMTRGSPLLSWNQNKDIKKKPSFESFFFVYETRFSFLFRN